jgi:hypothetical protein
LIIAGQTQDSLPSEEDMFQLCCNLASELSENTTTGSAYNLAFGFHHLLLTVLHRCCHFAELNLYWKNTGNPYQSLAPLFNLPALVTFAY